MRLGSMSLGHFYCTPSAQDTCRVYTDRQNQPTSICWRFHPDGSLVRSFW